MENGQRKLIYSDTTKGEVTIPINEHFARNFIECLLQSGYSVRIKGNGTDINVTIRRD